MFYKPVSPWSSRPAGVLLFFLACALGGVTGGQLAAQDRPVWADSIYAVVEADLQRVLADQEDFIAENQSYAIDLGTLGCETSRGVTIGVVASTAGFSAVAMHEALGTEYGCTVYLGDIDPPYYPLEPGRPGELACTPGAPPVPKPVTAVDLAAGPTFTPYDVPPALQNAKEVQEAMKRRYPARLKNDWIGGTAEVSLFICDRGTVRAAVLAKSSGHPSLDEAALAVVSSMAFEPAENQGQPVGVWVRYPITFKPGL